MNLATWRQDPNLIEAGLSLQKNKAFGMVIDMLKDELPTNTPLPQRGASAEDFAYAYGTEVGYRNCMLKLQLIGSPAVTAGAPEITFSDNNKESNNG